MKTTLDLGGVKIVQVGNDLYRLEGNTAEKHSRQMKVAKLYEAEGNEAFAQAYYHLAALEAGKGGVRLDPSKLRPKI